MLLQYLFGADAYYNCTQVLMLAGQNFTGSLPFTSGLLSNLTVLDVSHNQLTGSMPTSYSSMRQLAVLKVQENQMTAAHGRAASLFDITKVLVEQGELQCLCVDANNETLLDRKEKDMLQHMANPAVPLAINSPADSSCDHAPWKS
jgi:Leucine-rich repeat (LRR) protein